MLIKIGGLIVELDHLEALLPLGDGVDVFLLNGCRYQSNISLEDAWEIIRAAQDANKTGTWYPWGGSFGSTTTVLTTSDNPTTTETTWASTGD